MTEHINIVVPIKGLHCGKSRLQSVLTDKERYSLNKYLSSHTLSIAVAVKKPFAPYVISPDTDIEPIAKRAGAKFLLQKTIGLNNALLEAARCINNGRTIYLASDLPELEHSDLEALTDLSGIGIAPDQEQAGTNAISLPTPVTIPFCFGKLSFVRHCSAAQKLKTTLSIVRRPGLEFDIDTKEDLNRWKGWPLPKIKRRL